MRSFFAFPRQMGAQLRSSLRAIFERSRVESEMDLELENHLESLIGDLMRAGHSRAEASRRARIALGPALVHKEGMRASLGWWWCAFDPAGAWRGTFCSYAHRVEFGRRGIQCR